MNWDKALEPSHWEGILDVALALAGDQWASFAFLENPIDPGRRSIRWRPQEAVHAAIQLIVKTEHDET